MTKPFFWIVFALVLAGALFLGLRREIANSQSEIEKRLLLAIESRIGGSPSSGALAGGMTVNGSTSPESLLQTLEETSEKIPILGKLPEAQKKEKERAEQAEKELAALGAKGFALIESRFQKSGGSLEFRRRLLRLLEKIDGDRAFKVAEAAFEREGEDYNVRWAAAAIMREISGAKTLPIVSEFLVRHNGHAHPGMSYLVDTLAEIGGHEVALTLIQVMLDQHKEISVRNAAVRALGEMRAVEAYSSLEDIVSASPIHYLRINAARAMLQIKDREGCEFLREILRQEKSEDFKQFLEQLLRDRCPG